MAEQDGDVTREPGDAARSAMRIRDIVLDDVALPFSMRPNHPQEVAYEPAYVEQEQEDYESE